MADLPPAAPAEAPAPAPTPVPRAAAPTAAAERNRRQPPAPLPPASPAAGGGVQTAPPLEKAAGDGRRGGGRAPREPKPQPAAAPVPAPNQAPPPPAAAPPLPRQAARTQPLPAAPATPPPPAVQAAAAAAAAAVRPRERGGRAGGGGRSSFVVGDAAGTGAVAAARSDVAAPRSAAPAALGHRGRSGPGAAPPPPPPPPAPAPAPAPPAPPSFPGAPFAFARAVAVPRELGAERRASVRDSVLAALPGASAALSGDQLLLGAATAALLGQATLVAETRLAQQLQLQRRFALKERLSEDVGRLQAEIEAGLRVEFAVEPSLLGAVIGQGGSHVRRVTDETGVDRVVVDREASVVRIVGATAAQVAQARAALEFVSVLVDVPEDKVGYIVGREGKNIADLVAKAGLSGAGGMALDRGRGAVRVTGPAEAVQRGVLLLESHLAFLRDSQAEAEDTERMRRQLEGLQQTWGEDSFLMLRGGTQGGGAHAHAAAAAAVAAAGAPAGVPAAAAAGGDARRGAPPGARQGHAPGGGGRGAGGGGGPDGGRRGGGGAGGRGGGGRPGGGGGARGPA